MRSEAEKKRWRDYYQANKSRLLARQAAVDPVHRREIRQRSRRKQRGQIEAPTYACPTTCENCGGLPQSKPLQEDHDHRTGKFRGWLCVACNTGIGKLGDDVVGLERALAYLKSKL